MISRGFAAGFPGVSMPAGMSVYGESCDEPAGSILPPGIPGTLRQLLARGRSIQVSTGKTGAATVLAAVFAPARGGRHKESSGRPLAQREGGMP